MTNSSIESSPVLRFADIVMMTLASHQGPNEINGIIDLLSLFPTPG